ncbi:FlgO family outer membrane protein [Vogesella indigofera]|uniref:FlgO family outer membrane protein n=1 Tax=Vogesella indigofera TaxID=45465 RepID=A0ABT5I885_VOGIN|nr:FlgO family outer membrane protein [Vogesella indigofera]MDC7691661.1 FlgO family outer membrane protein [Vogesella indigofera]
MKTLISVVILSSLLTGCASFVAPNNPEPTRLIEANYSAVDALLNGVPLSGEQPLLVATLVNVDVLTESSRLGRLFSEQIAARLSKRGYPVKELKLRENLFMKQSEGELLLSREVGEVSRAHNARAVVVGTYAASGSMLYINLKLVHPSGNIVLSAHDYALPMDNNIRDLLGVRKTSYY